MVEKIGPPAPLLQKQLQKLFLRQASLPNDRSEQRPGEIAALVDRHRRCSTWVAGMHHAMVASNRANDLKTALLQGSDDFIRLQRGQAPRHAATETLTS